MIETFIATKNCYLGLFDLESAVRRHTFDRLIEQARLAAHADAVPWATIPYLNESLLEMMRRGEILAWIVLLDGCFKARVTVNGALLEQVESGVFLGSESHDLICPSGRIAIASLHELHEPRLAPVFQVSPGTYRVQLLEDLDQVKRHYYLETPHAYPAGEGPDWTLTLARR